MPRKLRKAGKSIGGGGGGGGTKETVLFRN